MGFTDGIRKVLRGAFAPAEDPRELSVTGSIRRQEMLLARVRAESADLESSRRRLEDRAIELRTEADRLGAEARRLVGLGQEEPARQTLRRRALAAHRIDELLVEAASVAAMRDRIGALENNLAARVDGMRSAHDVAAAQINAAGAHDRIADALESSSSEATDLSAAFALAAKESEQTRTRADGVERLLSRNAEPTPGAVEAEVEAELRSLEQEVRPPTIG